MRLINTTDNIDSKYIDMHLYYLYIHYCKYNYSIMSPICNCNQPKTVC
jgi:hypothetical protein